MLNYTEIIISSSLSIVIYNVINRGLKRRLQRDKNNEPLSYPYLWTMVRATRWDSQYYQWGCPKCPHSNRNGTEICECLEFAKPHFHMTCNSCKYKFIMRSKNDKK